MTSLVEVYPRVVVLGDMRDLHHHGCEAVMHELLAGLIEIGVHPSQVLPGLDWHPYADICLDADLVIINGEGALHHSRPAVEMVLELATRRREAGKPTALINTSWFANTISQTAGLEFFDLLAVRDPLSRGELVSVNNEILAAPDLAIRFALRSGIAASGYAPVMVSDSTEPALTRRLTRAGRRHNWTYLPVLANPVTPRPSAKSRKIVSRCRLGKALGPLAPLVLSQRYLAHLAGEARPFDYLQRLAAAGGLVSGRFHAICFAIGLRVPFVAVASNTPKIEALIHDAGLNPGLRLIGADKLESLESVPPFTAAELAALTAFHHTATNSWSTLFARINTLLTSPR